jgi:hypothetical protein
MSLIELLTCVLAWVVVVRTLRIAVAMNGTTDHMVRAAAVLLATGALGLALFPFYRGMEDWSVLLFVAGAAAWMSAEKRRNFA